MDFKNQLSSQSVSNVLAQSKKEKFQKRGGWDTEANFQSQNPNLMKAVQTQNLTWLGSKMLLLHIGCLSKRLSLQIFDLETNLSKFYKNYDNYRQFASSYHWFPKLEKNNFTASKFNVDGT